MLEHVCSIGLNTFRESIRGKILYTLSLCAFLVFSIGSLLGSFSIGNQSIFMKDFGLLGASWFSIIFSVVAGASLFEKEITRKTIYTILSRPLSRATFILGKYTGMMMTLAIMLALLGAGLLGISALFDQVLDTALLQAIYYLYLELLIVSAAGLFFSALVVTPSLSGVFTLCFFLAGRSSHSLQIMAAEEWVSAPLKLLLTVAYWVVPHLDQMYIGNEAAFGIRQSLLHTFCATSYAIGYAAALLALTHILFARREF